MNLKRSGVLLASLVTLLLTGCNAAINRFAFYPERTEKLASFQLPPNVNDVFLVTDDSIKIHSYFIPDNSSRKLLIYFHGNAGNISGRLDDLMTISRFGISVLGVSYRGYGKSDGRPSERGIYADGEAALKYATEDLGFALGNIILFGHSLGSTVAINTARNRNIAGLILVSPLASGADQARQSGFGSVAFVAGDAFDNIGKIEDVRSPILIIHGTNDRVIPVEMGRRLYRKAHGRKQLVMIEGGGHNDLPTRFATEYWGPVSAYVAAMPPGI